MVALALLRKVLPDVQSLEITGNSDQPIAIQLVRFTEDEPNSLDTLIKMPPMIEADAVVIEPQTDGRPSPSNPAKRKNTKG